jgi:hypothetical protein
MASPQFNASAVASVIRQSREYADSQSSDRNIRPADRDDGSDAVTAD